MLLRLDKEDMAALAKMIAAELREQPEKVEWQTTEEYAAECGKSPATIRRWCKDGKFAVADFKMERAEYRIKKGAKPII